MHPPTILHLLGNTGCGKTTLMDRMVAAHPNTIAGISVGRELRKIHPPSYFQGQAAPECTEKEALDLYRGFVETSVFQGYRLIIVDGQPRTETQVPIVVEEAYQHTGNVAFVLLDAPHALRAARLAQRDGDNPDAMALASARLDADYRNQYECMIALAKFRQHLDICDITQYTAEALVKNMLFRYHPD